MDYYGPRAPRRDAHRGLIAKTWQIVAVRSDRQAGGRSGQSRLGTNRPLQSKIRNNLISVQRVTEVSIPNHQTPVVMQEEQNPVVGIKQQ